MNLKSIKYFVDWIKLASKTIDNVTATLFYRLGFKNEVTIKTKTIGSFKVKNNPLKIKLIKQIMDFQKYALENEISDDKKSSFKKLIGLLCDDNDTITFEGITYLKNNMIFVLFEQFFEDGSFTFNNLENEVIIDIGGNIGDTALYFAKQGCEVYAYEPIPDIYEVAIKNIKLNPSLKDKIHFFNYAVSDKNEDIEIYYSGVGSSRYKKSNKKYTIKTVTLNQIINRLNDKNLTPTLLKIDCEGSEFDIIPNSDLSTFNEISLEYHSSFTGIPRDILINTLEKQGFIIKNIYPAPENDIPIEDIGIIHAVK